MGILSVGSIGKPAGEAVGAFDFKFHCQGLVGCDGAEEGPPDGPVLGVLDGCSLGELVGALEGELVG